jgi:hypothetical protein
MDSLLLILFAAVLIVGVIMLAGVTKFGRSRSCLDRAYFQKQWDLIESYKKNGSTGWQLAIFEADKLLDHALRTLSFGGQTMGDRLKDARGSLHNNDAVWSAHKLRNRLAHEQNVPLNGIVVDKALRSFKGALKDLGAL